MSHWPLLLGVVDRKVIAAAGASKGVLGRGQSRKKRDPPL